MHDRRSIHRLAYLPSLHVDYLNSNSFLSKRAEAKIILVFLSIKPFFDSQSSNLGLEKYGLALFDGVFHEEQLACMEQNGIKRYITGLNEFAPEIKLIKDKDERKCTQNFW